MIKTSKGKDAILHDGYYYNHLRDNKSSTVFKCRFIVDEDKKKECSGTFTLRKDGKFKIKEHQHQPLSPIEIEIMQVLAEIYALIIANPTTSIKFRDAIFTSLVQFIKKSCRGCLGTLYSRKEAMSEFTTWIRMCMAFPFLMLGDIDDVWEEMKDSRPDLNSLNKGKLDDFITYFEDTWIKEKCHFCLDL